MKFSLKAISSLVLGLLTAGSVSAAPVMDMGIVAGYRMNDGDSAVTGTSIDGVGAFQVGGLAFLPINDMFKVRTGFIYAQRNYEAKDDATGVKSDLEFAHFDIPLTVMYSLGDLGGIFAGPGLGLKISDDCGGQDCKGAKSTIVPITFGGHFKIAPQFSAEVFYEMVSGKLADSIEDTRAVGVNAIITFE
jgi:hypothetical protein